MSKLRLSSHRLFIESGRWNRPQPIPREERKCSFCDKLEDEYHFLFECSLYNDDRQVFIKSYYRRRHNMQKASELLQSNNKKEIKNLAIYIFKCFEKRNEAIFSN